MDAKFDEIKIHAPYGKLAGKLWNPDATGTPMIALHGWMDNSGTWDRVCPLLGTEFPVFALDFPGCGYSDLPMQQGGLYITDYLLAVHRVTEHFKWNKISLLGHSLGGAVSMLYSGAFPDKVKQLVMVDILKPISVDSENQPERTAESITQCINFESKKSGSSPRYNYDEILKKMLVSYGGSINENSAKILLHRGARRHADGTFSFTCSPYHKIKNTHSLTFEQQLSFASKIKCPLLIIRASQSSPPESLAICKKILDVYSKSAESFHIVELEGTHHLHMNDPIPISKVLKDFFMFTEVDKRLCLDYSKLYKSINASL